MSRLAIVVVSPNKTRLDGFCKKVCKQSTGISWNWRERKGFVTSDKIKAAICFEMEPVNARWGESQRSIGIVFGVSV